MQSIYCEVAVSLQLSGLIKVQFVIHFIYLKIYQDEKTYCRTGGLLAADIYDFIVPVSFNAVVDEVAKTRVYAGIHTRMACEAGLQEGSKVAQKIDRNLKFLKE